MALAAASGARSEPRPGARAESDAASDALLFSPPTHTHNLIRPTRAPTLKNVEIYFSYSNLLQIFRTNARGEGAQVLGRGGRRSAGLGPLHDALPPHARGAPRRGARTPSRTNWTRLVPPSVPIGRVSSLPPYQLDVSRPFRHCPAPPPCLVPLAARRPAAGRTNACGEPVRRAPR